MSSLDGCNRSTRVRVVRVRHDTARSVPDYLATEEPLELRLQAGSSTRTVATTMRTPGADFELAAGFLLSEGVVHSRAEIDRIAYCPAPGERRHYNALTVTLARERLPDLGALERFGVVTSACGLCGRMSLDDLEARGVGPVESATEVSSETLLELPTALRCGQRLFERTGGLHAAGLFTAAGALLCVREDVGRHNALDKLVGWALLEDRLPLDRQVLMLSGRASYELLLKAAVAGISVVASVSAPSSLAVALARRFGITLAGFVRDEGFNLYAHPERVTLSPGQVAEVPA